MSTASVHGAAHPAQVPTSGAAYAANSAYLDPRYANAGTYSSNSARHSQNSRQERRHNAYAASPSPEPQYYSSQNTDEYLRYAQAGGNPGTTTLPHNTRNQSEAADQFDGTPLPPPRTSSHQSSPLVAPVAPSTAPLEARVAATRHARQNTADQQIYGNQAYGGNYREPSKERSRDDSTTSAASAARHRRKGPSSPEGPHRATSTRERGQHGNAPTQSRSDAGMMATAAPAPLVREYSEVIKRVVVSDPEVDAERMQERVAEAQPASVRGDVSSPAGMDSVISEGFDDNSRGPARRQDYSKSSSRRKEVQFGDYMLGQTLGEGEFGKVKLGWKKDGSSQVAIKLIRRETVASNPSRLPKIYREISILRDLAHPNIVRLHEMVETERHIGIILEYASGGELFDYILNHRYLKDPAARRLFAQLVSGVGYLHKKGIVHRDLKLENLLLDQNRNIIITDFGFANTFNPLDELSDEIEYNLSNKDFVRKFKLDRLDAHGMRRGDLMQTSCGSPCYAAPELVVSDSLYTGRKVDVWSCGVILYAMLAGYLPFDDDPANPEGDNINLLYKYITTTPLTFPEYVSPHARDLLRRILVPDPRKRADLFEVARHSWLTDITAANIHNGKFTGPGGLPVDTDNKSESRQESPGLNRSTSLREPTKPASQLSPTSHITRTPEGVVETDTHSTGSKRERGTRHTLQTEYVAPQTHTVRGAPTSISAATYTSPKIEPEPSVRAAQQQSLANKPLPQEPKRDSNTGIQQKMPPPVRPARDVPRSVSNSTGAFAAIPAAVPQQQSTRPSTQGSLNSAGGPAGTRSDLRLPSRGSYGQPVAPTVAATNVQGRVTQPVKPARGYNISGPLPAQNQHSSIGQPMTQSMPPPSRPTTQPEKSGHHRRSSTLSGLGERLFGRTNSVRKKDEERQKNGRKYPPTSMKHNYGNDEPHSRLSTDSKRSFSFGLGKKRSTDLESQTEKPGKRFSLIPNSLSLKGIMGGNKESADSPGPEMQEQQRQYHRSPSALDYNSQPVSSQDGQQDHNQSAKYNNFSRPPQGQYRQAANATPPSNDVYGGTGVYVPNQSRGHHVRGASQPAAQLMTYPEEYDDQQQNAMQQGRPSSSFLTKNNRNFNDVYDNQARHHGGSSGAVKKVQDFFRRRGRARADSEYR